MTEDTGHLNPKPPPLDRLSLLWRQVKDHKIAQWTVGYVALAYAIQHGIILTSESLEWPNAVARISILLLALGLPVVIVCAWYQGEKANRRISGPELTIISLLLLTSSLLFALLVHPAGITTPRAQDASVTTAREAAANPRLGIALAVLPFLNLSGDPGQEFFSDGMTEEITAALAKVPDLRVVARTSAFEFKGKNINIKTMGEQLGATHLIEGSVRKAGNRLRITAQLIKADDGSHIWTEDYDRELTDVFAIQEDIARAITASLRMPLGLKPGENLVNNRKIDADSYEKFLRASGLVAQRGGAELAQASTLIEDVVARNPDFAPGWRTMSGVYYQIAANVGGADRGTIAELRKTLNDFRSKGESAAQRAIQLDPSLAGAHGGLAIWLRSRKRHIESEEEFQKALALDPNDPSLFPYSNTLAMVGRLKEAVAMSQKIHALDPLSLAISNNLGGMLWLNGQNDDAIELIRMLPLGFRAPRLSMIYATLGRYREAADQAELLESGNPDSDAARAARLLRSAQEKIPVHGSVPMLGQNFNFAFLITSAPDRVLEYYERRVEADFVPGFPIAFLWQSAYAPVRKTERFKSLMRNIGIVEYWRAKGWPEFCHPTTGDDFECS